MLNFTSKIFSRYGALGTLRLARDYALTVLWFRGARIVRHPWYFRGRKNIAIGRGFTAGVGLRMDAFCNNSDIIIRVGDNVQINDYVHIGAVLSVNIDSNTLIASKVFIADHNHGQFNTNDLDCGPHRPPILRPLSAKPVSIGKNVWIGESVCVLPGVSIGDGAVIGAGSVVSTNIPARCVAVGNPARVIREWDDTTHEWKRV
jgi:lipopolysaccharide O-acetyltransferase